MTTQLKRSVAGEYAPACTFPAQTPAVVVHRQLPIPGQYTNLSTRWDVQRLSQGSTYRNEGPEVHLVVERVRRHPREHE
jgi:hypothetical protein